MVHLGVVKSGMGISLLGISSGSEIDTKLKRAIFLLNKEDWCSMGRVIDG